jgi:hypothetical protein
MPQRIGRAPALFAGVVRRDGVVHIADRAHARVQAPLVTGQPMPGYSFLCA